MVLHELQSLLARLYDVPSEYDIYDFLITDRRRLEAHLPADSTPDIDEQVLVAQTAAGLRVSVYIDAAVLSRLSANSPFAALTETNLHDYCTALEGVSHFHYLTWRATRDRSVSLLELELQAEVDKYVAAICLLTAQGAGSFPVNLHQRLFHHVRFVPQLDNESHARYRTANRHAARFCRRLEERFLRRRRTRPEAWLAELRHFYRCSHGEKLRHSAG